MSADLVQSLEDHVQVEVLERGRKRLRDLEQALDHQLGERFAICVSRQE